MKINTIIICLVIIISSCRCGTLDCATSEFDGRYRLIDSKTKNDLLFGPNKIYDKSKIKFFELRNGDTTFIDFGFGIAHSSNRSDSVITLNEYKKISPLYMKLSSTDVDTIINSYIDYNSKCCGLTTTLNAASFNRNKEVQRSSGAVIILEK